MTTQRKLLIVGGGTGGHIYPAIATAQAWLHAGCGDVVMVGRTASREEKNYTEAGLRCVAVVAAPMNHVSLMRRIVGLGTIVKSLWQATGVLRRERPDCVVGTGGYVSGTVVLAARLLGIPTVIQEQNSVPGLTNRWLGRLVNKVCYTFNNARQYFAPEKIVCTGIPIRADIVERLRSTTLPLAPPYRLLVVGGSQGAVAMNRLVLNMLPFFAAQNIDLQVLHQIGANMDCAEVEQAYQAAGITARVVPFIHDMPTALSESHVAISRAGAGSIMELALAGIPTCFVPLPTAADNHQMMNATDVASTGGAHVFDQNNAQPEEMAAYIGALLRDQPRIETMRQAMQKFASADAAQRVVTVCQKLLGTNGSDQVSDTRCELPNV